MTRTGSYFILQKLNPRPLRNLQNVRHHCYRLPGIWANLRTLVTTSLTPSARVTGDSDRCSVALSDHNFHKVTIVTKSFGTPCFEHLLTRLSSTSTTTSSSPCFMLLMDYIYSTSQCVLFQLRSRTVVTVWSRHYA